MVVSFKWICNSVDYVCSLQNGPTACTIGIGYYLTFTFVCNYKSSDTFGKDEVLFYEILYCITSTCPWVHPSIHVSIHELCLVSYCSLLLQRLTRHNSLDLFINSVLGIIPSIWATILLILRERNYWGMVPPLLSTSATLSLTINYCICIIVHSHHICVHTVFDIVQKCDIQ